MFSQQHSNGVVEASDDYFKNVTMLLHGDGTNGAQNNTFVDSSSNAFSITRNGNTTQGSFSPYGSNWSMFTDGGCYLQTSHSGSIGSSDDFTIECFAYLTATQDNSILCIADNSTGLIYFRNGSRFSTTLNGTTVEWQSSAITLNTWHHLVVQRSSGTVSAYLDGTRVGTPTSISGGWSWNTITGSGTPFLVGQSNIREKGYLSNVRYSNVARYSGSTLTVPTSQFVSDSNTVFLLCSSNRFKDASSNAYSITVNGAPSVQRFSPFAPSSSYDSATVGGSGYFDGSGDYLQVAPSSTTPFAMGTGDFTLEFWYYPTSVGSGVKSFYDPRPASSDAIVPNIYMYNGELRYIVGSSDQIYGATLTAGQWYHIAVARSGTSTKMFVNGVQYGSTYSDSNNYVAYSDRPLIFANTYGVSSYNPAGYCGGFRLVKGTALYTTTFTPPTSPLSAVSGTSLLLNFTNGAIIDNAMMNDLETVGNSQISTSVKKFGTGSIAFDGTGDYLTHASSQNFAFGTGDFTIEGWVNFKTGTNLGREPGIFQIGSSPLQASISTLVVGVSGTSNWMVYNGAQATYPSGSVSTNTWYHFAYVRYNGTLKLYINGTSIYSVSDSTNYTYTYCTVGGYYDSSYLLEGYVDDFRVTKGYARYTSNFSVPTSAFPNK